MSKLRGPARLNDVETNVNQGDNQKYRRYNGQQKNGKMTTMIYKTLHWKLKIKQQKRHSS